MSVSRIAKEGYAGRQSGRSLAERVVILAPTGDDAGLVSRILEEQGREVIAVLDVAALVAEFESGAGVAVIASEALTDRGSLSPLRELLERQEAWSDIPLLLLGGSVETDASRATELLGSSAQIVLLERPLGIATFLTAIDAALRGRRRQYEVRRLLSELEESAGAVARAHEEAARAKDEFLATLAHELRSPMTAIRGWIEILKGGDLDANEAADALKMIESSTRVQAHIVEDLMDISRILAGKVMIQPSAVELAPVVESVVATFRPTAVQHGIELIAEISPERLWVWGDEVRLQQVGWNLVSNAIKFTGSGGSVRVILERKNDSAAIRVKDTGQGIARSVLPYVFERYRQEGDPAGRKHHGLGLGLAIVHHLIVSHGGRAEAFSEGPGLGSEFVVTLPLLAGSASESA